MDRDGEVLVPMPTYPLYTAVLAKLDAQAKYYRLDPANGWMPDLDHLGSLVTPAGATLTSWSGDSANAASTAPVAATVGCV